MRTFIFIIALLFSGSAYASPDCANYGGDTLAGCGATDFAVSAAQDTDHGFTAGPGFEASVQERLDKLDDE